MLYWSAFMFVLFFVLICINVILRKQFTEHERLTYPITWMPLEMGRDITGFLRNKLMWLGFGIAAGISLLNGLHTLFPFVPAVPVWWQRVSFVEKPWSYAGGVLVSFQPFVIGLSYFMPLDLAFSAWFFFILQLLIRVLLGAAMGIRNPYFDEQAQGGWIGLGILALWVGRRHLKRAFFQTFSGKNRFDDSSEPMRYRTAVLGIIAGLLFLIAFAYKAGLSAWVMLMFLVLYLFHRHRSSKTQGELGGVDSSHHLGRSAAHDGDRVWDTHIRGAEPDGADLPFLAEPRAGRASDAESARSIPHRGANGHEFSKSVMGNAYYPHHRYTRDLRYIPRPHVPPRGGKFRITHCWDGYRLFYETASAVVERSPRTGLPDYEHD